MDSGEPTAGSAEPRRRTSVARLVVLIACALQLALGIFWSLLVPPFQGLDEQAHVAAVEWLAEHASWPGPHDLPVTQGLEGATESMPLRGYKADPNPLPRDRRPSFADGGTAPAPDRLSQMSQHPPLGYVPQAIVLRLVPHWHVRHYDVAVMIMRWVSAVEIAPLPWLAYLTMRRFTRDRWLSGAATLFPLLLPGLARAGGTVSNDPLQILLTSALVWLTVRVATGDRTIRTAAAVGGVVLLDLLTKGTSLVEPVWVAAAYGWLWWSGRRAARAAAADGPAPTTASTLLRPVAIVVAFVVAGLAWWARNVVLYGAVQPTGGYLRAMVSDPTHEIGRFVTYYFSWMSFRFWGSLGNPEPPGLDRGLTIWATSATLTLLVIGLVVARRRRLLVAALVPVLGFLLGFGLYAEGSFAAFRRTSTFTAVQGRYLYPFALALVPLVVLGLGALLRGRARPWTVGLVAAAAVSMQVYAAKTSAETRFAAPRIRTWTVLEQWAPVGPGTVRAITGTTVGLAVVLLVVAVGWSLVGSVVGSAGDSSGGSAGDPAGDSAGGSVRRRRAPAG